MNAPARILRAAADGLIPPCPCLTARERERRDIILRAGRTLMAEFGRHGVRLSDFASAIRISPAAIRRHFADLDNLLGTILRDHLMEVVSALGLVPRETTDRARALRTAYLGATRTGLGASTAAHLLLIRDSHLLPPDELASIDAIRDSIAQIIGGEHAALTLALLDTPHIHPSRMEAVLDAVLETARVQDMAPPAPVGQPTRVAPFTPRPRPLAPKLPPAGQADWPGQAQWDRATPAARANGCHGKGFNEAARRASS